MALDTYNSKRHFDRTPEPKGERAKRTKSTKTDGFSFVIQKHDARRLHYDFRLELDGVLKSWAVTRGPSLDPGDKRLAVHVEDHPLSYGDFEGIIPKGQYGGGTVIVWDRGTWKPIDDPHKGYRKGHLEFELDGEKLQGRWHLVRMKGREEGKRENWLLIKGEDEAADPDTDIVETMPDSVKSGRSIAAVARDPGDSWNSRPVGKAAKRVVAKRAEPQAHEFPKGAGKRKLPDFVPPALATLKASPPRGEKWLHEIKFDGYRLQAHIQAGEVKLLTRSGLDWTAKFGPDVLSAFKTLAVSDALIDGEIVVEKTNGSSDFSLLQQDLSEGRKDRFVFYAFDLLHLDGHDLCGAGLEDRKSLLEKLLPSGQTVLRYSEHFTESGDLVLEHACRLSLEGVVSKQRDGNYVSGRKGSWIKSKCSHRQELVIGGFMPSSVSPHAIGALALGVHEDDGLRHVGRVGTGFSQTVAEELFGRLDAMTQDKSPFSDKLTALQRRDLVYVRPELIAEVEFRGWSADGNLRHASFRGLREDKQAAEVVREMPTTKEKAKPAARSAIKLTHPDRIYWPEEGITKQGLADYYAEVWRFIAPFIVDRPLSLLRCPEGIEGQRFFQKHVWRGMNKAIGSVADPKDKSGDPLVRILDFDGLMGLVQAAVLEIHPWGATTRSFESPDMITMDLDPGEDVDSSAVIEGALRLKEMIEAAGLSAFVKTSGGKGLHVVVPLKPKARWTTVKAFAKTLAETMSKQEPDRYLSVATKAKRQGRIFIDYLRNGRGNTAVAPYSTRARPGAAVSMPIDWSELSDDVRPDGFTVENVGRRLSALKRDPWADFFEAAKPLQK